MDIVRGLQALSAGSTHKGQAGSGSSKAGSRKTSAAHAGRTFTWNGQVYVDKMASDLDFCADMLKHDAVGELLARANCVRC